MKELKQGDSNERLINKADDIVECLLTMLGKQHPRARCLLEHPEVDIGIAFLAYTQLSSLVEKMTMFVKFCGLTSLKIMKMLWISSDVSEVSIIPPDDHRVKKHRRGETGDDGLSSSHRSADVGNTFAPYHKASEPPPPCCREESGGYFKIKIIVMSPIPPCTFTRSLRQHDGRPECLLEMLVLPLSSLYLRFISFAFTSMGISLVF